MNKSQIAEKHAKYTIIDGKTGFTLDVSGMDFYDSDIESLSEKLTNAHEEMLKIEAGEIKNPDENRKVTHFTDRAVYPGTSLFSDVESFAEDIKNGSILSSTGKKFEYAVINGIGGSALGPQLLQNAINGPYWNELPESKRKGGLKIYFLDNTDTAELADLYEAIELEKTLVVTISKSGGTQETKNNMIALRDAFTAAKLDFSKHACAITMNGSELHQYAKSSNWLQTFEMAESIGGRTSETSIVGHVPAALAGINFKNFLNGACHMDRLTREPNTVKNPAYLLATMWYIAGEGKGNKNMVIVPYSDRLILMSRYLQQLVMESLGKEKDLDGNTVYQGLNVFGNKGGTDAHAFIQQLNDGRNDFFITFIEILRDSLIVPVEDKITMGDYLHGFLCGLTDALLSKDRQVIQICLNKLDEFNIGMLIALYERAVAFYAELIHINAFHQPGVQAYKLASKGIIKLTKELQTILASVGNFEGTAKELVGKQNIKADLITIEGILAKFAENSDRRKFPGFTISREWSVQKKNWIYKVKAS
ncbi:MAG: glucose-6-phosphate isomerase [Candidatus Nanoarchaeia archaeon]